MGDHLLRFTPPPPDDDYLSDLPDALLLRILSSLSTPDSVRTSVLSRRWRSLWASVPAIVFDCDGFDPEAESRTEEVVHQFIASRSNSCSVYSLRVPVYNVCSVSWVDYAKSHGVREVAIHVCDSPSHLTPFFSALFSWPSLSALDLRFQFVRYCPRVQIPPDSIALNNLKTLYLTVGVFEVQSMRRLFACCSKLEELTLDTLGSCYGSIEIEAPSLRKLSLTDTLRKAQITCPKLECLSVGSSCNLEEFHSYMPSLVSVHFDQIRHCHRLASRLCNVTELSTSLQSLPDCQEVGSVIECFRLFPKLKKLKIHLHLFHKYSMQLLFAVLMMTPNLNSLEVIDDREAPSLREFCSWRKSSIVKNIGAYKSFDYLKIISVRIKSTMIRSTFLRILSERVQAWDKVVVKCL